MCSSTASVMNPFNKTFSLKTVPESMWGSPTPLNVVLCATLLESTVTPSFFNALTGLHARLVTQLSRVVSEGLNSCCVSVCVCDGLEPLAQWLLDRGTSDPHDPEKKNRIKDNRWMDSTFSVNSCSSFYKVVVVCVIFILDSVCEWILP